MADILVSNQWNFDNFGISMTEDIKQNIIENIEKA